MDLFEYVNTCLDCQGRLSEEDLDKGRCYECGCEFSGVQRRYALGNPEIYTSEITLTDGSIRAVIEMADGLVDGRILHIFGVFAVTDEGLECLDNYYALDRRQLNQQNWVEHMSHKTWVNVPDFSRALDKAKEIHGYS